MHRAKRYRKRSLTAGQDFITCRRFPYYLSHCATSQWKWSIVMPMLHLCEFADVPPPLQDITHEYVDPDKDAYIPEGSHHPHPWVRPHPKYAP